MAIDPYAVTASFQPTHPTYGYPRDYIRFSRGVAGSWISVVLSTAPSRDIHHTPASDLHFGRRVPIRSIVRKNFTRRRMGKPEEPSERSTRYVQHTDGYALKYLGNVPGCFDKASGVNITRRHVRRAGFRSCKPELAGKGIKQSPRSGSRRSNLLHRTDPGAGALVHALVLSITIIMQSETTRLPVVTCECYKQLPQIAEC